MTEDLNKILKLLCELEVKGEKNLNYLLLCIQYVKNLIEKNQNESVSQ